MSIPEPAAINEIDMELMLLVMKGYTSSYTLWTYVQNNKTDYIKAVAYKNVNQRFLRLARLGYVAETQIGDNPHRRIDYKVTIKGIGQLIPYMLNVPKEFPGLIKYMDKFELDKNRFALFLLKKHTDLTRLLNIFQDQTSILFTDSYWNKLKSENNKLSGQISQTLDTFNEEMETLVENISEGSDSARKYNESIDKIQELELKTSKELEEDNVRIKSKKKKYN